MDRLLLVEWHDGNVVASIDVEKTTNGGALLTTHPNGEKYCIYITGE